METAGEKRADDRSSRAILDISFEFSPKVGTRQLPELDDHYQSSVKGLYIVGDLADAPVIKISLMQGYDVVQQLFRSDLGGAVPSPAGDLFDLVIIGAGPAGIGAALACKKLGLRYALVERERPLNTIQNFPKHKRIFSEPREFGHLERFAFIDRVKEDLVAEWEEAIDEHGLEIRQPEEVVDVEKTGDRFRVHTLVGEGERLGGPEAKPGDRLVLEARRVVLAIGRRGAVNRLGCQGEEGSPKVAYALSDPGKHASERVLVVGGGDSAIEAAVALAEAGAEVAISYRQDAFVRATTRNKDRVRALVREGKIAAHFETTVKEIAAERVVLKGKAGDVALANDRVFVLIGTSLPIPFLKKIGVRMEGEFTWQRTLWIASFAIMTYLFYVLKTHKDFFPFSASSLGFVHEALKVPFGKYVDGSPRFVDASFWGTVIYSLMITTFGVLAIRRYRSRAQTVRYLCLIGFQLVFLFGIPELVAPLVIEKPWRMYSVSVPWPLSIWSLYHPELGWFLLGAGVAFVGVPLFVRHHGERFCSWFCGCGGLAETLGDRWRHLAPRGATSVRLEGLGRVVLGAAAVTTALILGVDIFHFFRSEALVNAKVFAQAWYGLMVDFWFACVVGVAFYPYLGNRVWCRFLCPLRAYMELLSRWFGRLKIVSNDRCIGCGECTRYCQMGIPVQKFAQMRDDFGNHNSACIQCGICVEVCPMDVLTLVRSPTGTRAEAKRARKSLPIVTG